MKNYISKCFFLQTWRLPSAKTGMAPIGRAKTGHKAKNPIDLKTISIPRISNFFSNYKIFGLIFLNAIAHKSRRGRSGDNMNICVFLRMRMGD